MKILHCSDIHIGSKMETKLTRERARERKRELILGFRALLDAARDGGYEALVIAGDLFDEERVPESTVKTVVDLIAAAPVTVFYLPGNHEGEALRAACPELPQNLRVFGRGWTEHHLAGVRFAGRSETEAELLRGLSPSEEPTVLVLHGELRERSEAGGVIGRRELAKSEAAYVALGHYHTYSEERLASGASAVYSGAPLGRGFDETGEKGYVAVELDGRRATHLFVPLAGRRTRVVDVPADGADGTHELELRILEACREASRGDMVRARLTGHRLPSVRFDTALIERRLSERFFYFEIRDETRLEIYPASYEHDRSLKGEFIRTVIAEAGLDEKEKEDVISCGLAALMGESIE